MSDNDRISAAIALGDLQTPIELSRRYDSDRTFQVYKIWRNDNSLFWQLSFADIKPSGKMKVAPSQIFSSSFSSNAELTEELARKLKARLDQGFSQTTPTVAVTSSVTPVPLEEQLANLKECGITLSPKVTIKDLLEIEDREELEALPYESLMRLLAMAPDWPSRKYRSPQLSDLDQECIYQRGDYSKVLKRFIRITAGDLQLTELNETFNRASGTANLSFLIAEQKFNWNFTLDGDWLDPHFFDQLAELAQRLELPKQWCGMLPDLEVFSYLSAEGQRKLEVLSGLQFVPIGQLTERRRESVK